jgi:type II secretory pathway pseudopilin PulG
MQTRFERGTTRNFKGGARSGFTLLQIVVVLSVLAILMTMTVGVFGRGRAVAKRAQCDMHLKAIAVALDAFRQERGSYPQTLAELQDQKYLQDPGALHCPADPRHDGTYEEFYVLRSPRDSGERPIVVCPFHEQDKQGAQAYKGVYTSHFAVKSARLESAVGATVQRPGTGPIAAAAGMSLRGGDRIRTGAGGVAKIVFSDGSSSELQANSDLTVLESFLAGQEQAPLYTLVRQTLGVITHRVNPGSKFDVVTPTGTAGALGTVFKITIADSTGATPGTIEVIESRVYLSDPHGLVVVSAGSTVSLPSKKKTGWGGGAGGGKTK